MKKLTFIKTLACVAMLLGFTVTSNSQAYIRATRYGATKMDVGRGIITDNDGSYFVTGYFTDSIDLGGGYMKSAGGRDIFIAKYSTAGLHQWSVRAGGVNDDEGASVKIDGGDSVYVTGYYTGATSGNFTTTASWGGRDIFVHKLNKATGASYGVYMAGSAANDEGMGIAYNKVYNTLYVTGYYNNNCKFNSAGVVGSTLEDVFTINLNTKLQNIWVRTGGSAGNDRGHSVCTDDSGRVFATGYCTGNATFSAKTIASYGGTDIFFVKYDGAGNIMGLQRAGSATNDAGNGITCDAVGNIYATGYHSNNATFGGVALAAAGFNIFVTSLDYTLAFTASITAGSATNDAGNGIVYDRACNTIYATGYVNNNATFCGGAAIGTTGQAVFLLCVNPALVCQWVNVANGVLDEQGLSVSSNGSRRVMVTGFTQSNNCSFSGNICASVGAADVFAAEFQEAGAGCAGGGSPEMFDPENKNTNVETVVNINDINIYPNPTNNIVNLNTNDVITKVIVIDLAGKVITTSNPNTNTTSLDLSDYPNGIYILNITINGQQYHKKIIKE